MGNLTVQAGLRWDRQTSFNPAATAAANPLIGTPITVPIRGAGGFTTATLPALNYPGDDRKLNWKSISPRIGATYALGADKKTLLRAGYNRYVSQMGSLISYLSPLGSYSYFTFLGNDANGDHIPQRSELQKIQNYYNVDPANPASLASVYRADYGMKPPHSDEFIVGFERELLSDFSVGFNYTYRKYRDIIEARAEHTQGKGDFFTRADYIAVGKTSGTYQILDPNGNVLRTVTGPVVTYYDVKNPDDVPTFFVYRNRPDYSRSFNGFEVTANKRLSNKWMLRGNFSWNDWKEKCGADAVADPTPMVGNCPGGVVVERSGGSGNFDNVFLQTKWTYNVTGLYLLPWDFNIGASLVGRQGYPRPLREVVSVPSGGTDEVTLQPIGSVRFPNVMNLDVRLAKDFRFFNRVGVTLAGDLFNVMNRRTILQRETTLPGADNAVANADYIIEMQSPRVWRLSTRISF
jgi:hypothetical protein